MRVLAGDVGGTHARLALVDLGDGGATVVREERYPSAEYPGLAPIVQAFLGAVGERPERAGYGIAGPVVDGRSRTTNLPWTVDAQALGRTTGIPSTVLINDFHAVGLGIPCLAAGDLVTLQEGTRDPHGPIALIGAGTGLGEGYLTWDGSRYRVHGSEGGHVTFAPRTDLEWHLAAFLREQYGHVSYERLLSGAGIGQIYRYLASSGFAPELAGVREEMTREDPAAVVTRHGLDRTDPLSARALEIFVTVYGRQAGHLAITLLASGGVYIAGGIAPKILPRLTDGTFMAAFRDLGRLAHFLETVPVHVIVNPDVGLLGAAAAARDAS
jgi:glucokinase